METTENPTTETPTEKRTRTRSEEAKATSKWLLAKRNLKKKSEQYEAHKAKLETLEQELREAREASVSASAEMKKYHQES